MKEKIKKVFKSKILFLILGILIGGVTSAYAVTYFPSNQVTYNNSSSKLNATQVQAAIDELYGKCKTCTSTGGSGNNIYVVDTSGNVDKSTGGLFSSANKANTSGSAVGIAVSGNNIYVADTSGNVYKSTGGLFSFMSKANTSSPAAGIAVSGNNIYVVDTSGNVYKSTGGLFSFMSKDNTSGYAAGIAVG